MGRLRCQLSYLYRENSLTREKQMEEAEMDKKKVQTASSLNMMHLPPA
ncbi:hypothetical protein CCACVL1_21539 [Corchorus capsularis]|uniref:Uncharacterized protein n=1 Tax=Corchorus capsularis TaxID=210143 RepID=A0A1R3H4V7_COCAP|nr:hypothetical protein CCACVL1_21539 [Corchorus capsularis]